MWRHSWPLIPSQLVSIFIIQYRMSLLKSSLSDSLDRQDIGGTTCVWPFWLAQNAENQRNNSATENGYDKETSGEEDQGHGWNIIESAVSIWESPENTEVLSRESPGKPHSGNSRFEHFQTCIVFLIAEVKSVQCFF